MQGTMAFFFSPKCLKSECWWKEKIVLNDPALEWQTKDQEGLSVCGQQSSTPWDGMEGGW